jgi:hypothetical protein
MKSNGVSPAFLVILVAVALGIIWAIFKYGSGPSLIWAIVCFSILGFVVWAFVASMADKGGKDE